MARRYSRRTNDGFIYYDSYEDYLAGESDGHIWLFNGLLFIASFAIGGFLASRCLAVVGGSHLPHFFREIIVLVACATCSFYAMKFRKIIGKILLCIIGGGFMIFFILIAISILLCIVSAFV